MLPGGAFMVLLLVFGGVSTAPLPSGELDFPPVELEDLGNSAMSVSFTHPLVFYGEKPAEPFHFTVSTGGEDFNGSCTAQEDCKRRVSFPLGVEKCVTLRGDGAFRDTGRVCLSGEPPLNVTLSCRHLNVSVSWQHGGPPGAGFRVHMGGSAGLRHQVNDTTALRFDLNRFVWASERRYLGFLFVTVTAKEGRGQSASATRTFSYNLLKFPDVRCDLDFPTVVLKDSESGATLSFRNPLDIHEKLRPASAIQFSAGGSNGSCSAADDLCKLDLLFPEGAKKCVKTLTGTLLGRGGVGKVAFRKTGPVCASSSTDANMLTLGIMLLLLLIIVVVMVIIAVWKAKAYTMKTLPNPRIPPMENHEEGLRYAPVPYIDISPLTVTDHRARMEEEEEEEDEEAALQCGGGGHQPDPQYADGGLSEGSCDDSGEMEAVEMEEQEAALQGGGGADFLPIGQLYAEGELSERELSEASCEDDSEAALSPYDCRHDL
ncbi:uncharacterized protein LOC130189545 isoform X2 [Pseudoliparis swirei]|uniref:uncharacterized protein LOC130189545 isoform X2 n=1 Tax=Pseudoliparis swirei TaxID=2059687 RepID=UPI0024BDC1AA|nr:uncharacterized protein LOC130189545 isoform X2 [Pseudoliparis swirei]